MNNLYSVLLTPAPGETFIQEARAFFPTEEEAERCRVQWERDLRKLREGEGYYPWKIEILYH